MSRRVWLGAVLGGLLIVGVPLWLTRSDGGLAPTAQPNVVITDPEEWVRAVAEAGVGEVRVSATPPGPAEGGDAQHQQPMVVQTLGPLAIGARDAVVASLDRQVASRAKKLSEASHGSLSATKELETLVTMTILMAVRERITAGDYLTIPQGEPCPPTPKGCKSMELTPHQTASGEWATVFVLIDAKKVEGLEEMQSSLRVAAKQDREQRLHEWNSQEDAVRSEAIQRQIQLRIKAGEDPSKNLSSDEFAQYSSMELFLDELRVDIVPGRTILYPR